MADTGKQSPLGINVAGSYLLNQGLSINPVASSYMGASKTNSDYKFGSLVSNTSLRMLTWAINDGYNRGQAKPTVPNNTIVAATNLITGCPYEILNLSNDTLPATAITVGNTYKIVSIDTGAIVNAGFFVIGQTYGIRTVGTTDFTLIGASSNTVGVIFTATGVGSGSGDAFFDPTDFTLIGASENEIDVVFTATGVGTGTGTVSYNGILPVVAVTIGSLYQIKTVENTDFTLIGSADNDEGTIFTATGIGVGNGTVVGITDFTKLGATKVTAGNLVIGQKYIILTLGSTDFTFVGASSNTVGLVFTATRAGTGTGEAINVNFIATGTGTDNGTVLSASTLTDATYNNLISIGENSIPALGNAKPPTYKAEDPSGVWTDGAVIYGIQQGEPSSLPGPATSGYAETSVIGQGQQATWLPYNTTNPNSSITQWGYIRLHALQAWNEFNYNTDDPLQATPQYKDFLSSFMTFNSFMTSSNQTIYAISNSNTFMEGIYSNMSDLISGDITGVSLSAVDFGTDLENLGKALDLRYIATFGTPSTLLATIGKSGAMTKDLGLALLASGLSNTEISNITGGIVPNSNTDLEQKIYGAFLIITGENLTHVLAPLQCKTQGLETLADLLNLRKMFPISYESLTVPVYNGITGLPTNSKTYYPIYVNGGINLNIDSPAIKEYVGTIIPSGTPPIFNNTVSPANYQELPKGFGSYLANIIPADQAIAAGAFSYSMRQIKNIELLDFEKFARVAKGIENTVDLPLLAGTNKPTNQASTDDSKEICSLGSGPAGSYTMSDFFGSMSGLPYPWKKISQRITQLDTNVLANIYQQLFLAVTWEPAAVTVNYTTRLVGSTIYYTVVGLTINNKGGGYGRGGAPAPTITLSNGGYGTTQIGNDDQDAKSDGEGTYGRVISVELASAGAELTTIPIAIIEYPPTSGLGGSNTPNGTAGWSDPMNAVVQGYINQANTEISRIASVTANLSTVQHLNEYWNILGKQLAREQRSRYIGSSPVDVPIDSFINPYPNSIYSFIDSIPTFSQDTTPHGSAQTIEAISDMDLLGGQSTIGMMRQERNQARLQQLGIDPDSNIPDAPELSLVKTLLANGTVPGAVDGIASPNGNEYTLPAWFNNIIDGEEIVPKPEGLYVSPTGFQQTEGLNDGDITPILNGDPNPVVALLVPAGPIILPENRTDSVVIIAPPSEYNPNNLPPNLDPNYTSSTLLPSTLSVQQAIDSVVDCNCDCWVQ
jgi:hypothetical protein